MGIEQTVAALRADAEDGALEELCARHDVDLLVLFGSARTSPPTAGDIDLAYTAARGADVDVLRLLDDLDARYPGVRFDVMAVDRVPPTDYRSGFDALVRLGILPEEIADELKLSVDLRTNLVHEYADVEIPRVVVAARRLPVIYREYVRAVARWLSSGGATAGSGTRA